MPHARVIYVANGLSGLPENLAMRETHEVNAWVCRGLSCFDAVHTPEGLLGLCKGTKGH